MKRYSVATSCMIESPRNSILWLWPLDKKNKGTASGVNRGKTWRENTRLPKDNVGNETICGMGGGLKKGEQGAFHTRSFMYTSMGHERHRALSTNLPSF